MGEFNAWALASIGWAFVMAGQLNLQPLTDNPHLFASLARMAEWRMCAFNEQGPSITSWAFATLNRPDEKLFAALAKTVEQRMSKFNARNR